MLGAYRKMGDPLFVLGKERESALCTPTKTAMMLLVVLYHSCVMWGGSWFVDPAVRSFALGVFAQWLNTFHVPVFVFMSGYLYAYLKGETDRYGGMRSLLPRGRDGCLFPMRSRASSGSCRSRSFSPVQIRLSTSICSRGRFRSCGFLSCSLLCFSCSSCCGSFLGRRMLSVSVGTVACAVTLYCCGCALGKVLPVDVGQIASACQFARIFWAGMAFLALPTLVIWEVTPVLPSILHFLMFALTLFMGTREGAASPWRLSPCGRSCD